MGAKNFDGSLAQNQDGSVTIGNNAYLKANNLTPWLVDQYKQTLGQYASYYNYDPNPTATSNSYIAPTGPNVIAPAFGTQYNAKSSTTGPSAPAGLSESLLQNYQALQKRKSMEGLSVGPRLGG